MTTIKYCKSCNDMRDAMSAFTKICCTGTVAWTSWLVIQFNTPLYHFIPGSNHHRERAERERKRKREGEGQRESEGLRRSLEGSEARYTTAKLNGSRRRVVGEKEEASKGLARPPCPPPRPIKAKVGAPPSSQPK